MRRVCHHHSSAENCSLGRVTTDHHSTAATTCQPNPLPHTAPFIPERPTHTWYARPSATLALYVRAVGHVSCAVFP
jgi:hypothetical protein